MAAQCEAVRSELREMRETIVALMDRYVSGQNLWVDTHGTTEGFDRWFSVMFESQMGQQLKGESR
jgi:hypothetical protein